MWDAGFGSIINSEFQAFPPTSTVYFVKAISD